MRRDEPAIRRSGEDSAYRPDPETTFVFADVRDHQRRVGSSRAAKKADAVVNISFARPNRATPGPQTLQLRHRVFGRLLGLRRDRGARLVVPTARRLRRDPGSLATCSIVLVPDGYEPRDSVNSLTAFALNSGVYLVPFAMVPSSPIELRAMRNKNQFISDFRPILVMVELGLGKQG